MEALTRSLIFGSVTLLVIVLLFPRASSNIQRANHLGGMLIRSCMYGFYISGIQSQYDNGKNDRLWIISCLKVPQTESNGHFCKWTCEYWI